VPPDRLQDRPRKTALLGTRIASINENGKQVFVGELKLLSYTVMEQNDGRLKVRQQGADETENRADYMVSNAQVHPPGPLVRR